MKSVALGSVATIERKGVDPHSVAPDTLYLGLEHIERGGRIIGHDTVAGAQLASTKFQFSAEHVLFGKLRPNLGKVSRPNFAGVCSTDILPIRPGKDLDRNYLAHYLAQPSMVDFAASRTSGANLPRLSPTVLATFQVPLPSVSEQRRIAAILDHTDALRARRRQVLAHLDALIQSIFTEMFSGGDFDSMTAGALMPRMRNGLSPATDGTCAAKVLTLSSVTRGLFDPSAVKSGVFAIEPPAEKRITDRDFLICRGNGNKALVGVGTYSRENRPDLVFPDTVIAGTVDTTLVTMPFLEAAWRRRGVRAQIESVARTTNGTYKVNQQTLSGVVVRVPPLDLQEAFALRVARVAHQHAAVQRATTADNELFASLQSRAFRGEL